MAIKPFNSVAGFSVGETPANIILGNGYITTNGATFTANIAALGVLTDNLYYANGVPWDLQEPAGSNTEVQFNNAQNFGASSNFTFDTATANLGVSGNINLTTGKYYGDGSQLTGIDTSRIANGTSNVRIPAADGNIQLNVNGGLTANITDTGIVATGGNLDIANIIATGTGAFTGNLSGGNLNTGGLVDATGNVSGGNLTTAGLVLATGNVSGGNITTAGVVDATGNVSGANLTSAGVVEVTGNVIGGNITTVGLVSATGNVSGGNITTAGVVDATGNVSGANLTSGGVVEVTGNVIGGNITTVGLVSATGNVSGGNITTAGVVDATGNVSGANLTSGGVVEVTGNVIGGNITTVGVVSATGNVSGGNITTAGLVSATGNGTFGNVSGGNLVSASFFTGTLIDGTSNITVNNNGNVDLVSAGNTTVVITSTGANVTGTLNANGIATFGSVVSSQLTAVVGGNLTLTAGSTDQYVEIRPTGTGQVHVGGFKIESLGTPTASTDAATKQYVDDVAQGLAIQAPAIVASTGTLATMSGGTVTYDNGTAGVGATLTISGSTLTVIDGITLSTDDRIVIKDEATSAHNGIYTYTSSTVLTRATDFDTPTEMAGGDFVFIQQGTVYNDTGWVMTDPVTTIGTDPVTFVQFSGAGSFTAGAGLTLTGTVFSVNTDNLTTDIAGGNVVVKTSAQLTTPNIGEATGTSLTATGNVAGGNLTTAGIVSATGNIIGGNVYANSGTIGASLLTGTLTTAAQPNVTSVGTLTSLTVTGNTSSGNLSTGGIVSATGNVSGGNITTAGNIDTTAGIFNGDGYGISNIAAGNIVGLNLSGISNGTSNVDIATVNGNITLSVNSVSNVAIITATGLEVAGTAGISGDANIAGVVNVGVSEISTIGAESVTTTAITSEVIAQFPVAGLNGVEFIVKSIDSTGLKYGVATVLAVTDGTNVDFSIYGQAFLGATTGTLSVAISGANIALSTTPASSNSTVWTTQYRSI
jgi:hypothetical protein